MAKVAIVTGGTRGIGAAISRALKIAGFEVAANYRGDESKAEAFREETGMSIFRWDVSCPEESAAGVSAVETELGPVEVLVNNAGITRDGMFHKMSHDHWRAVIETNLGSMYAVTHAVIEGMRQRSSGRIINISSVNGQKGQLGQTNYAAAKAGIIGFTKALALENARKGVTVNCICPGYVDTEMVAGVPEQVLEGIVHQIPVGRLGRVDEIATLVSYLASDEAGFMTGAILPINGGQYMA